MRTHSHPHPEIESLEPRIAPAVTVLGNHVNSDAAPQAVEIALAKIHPVALDSGVRVEHLFVMDPASLVGAFIKASELDKTFVFNFQSLVPPAADFFIRFDAPSLRSLPPPSPVPQIFYGLDAMISVDPVGFLKPLLPKLLLGH